MLEKLAADEGWWSKAKSGLAKIIRNPFPQPKAEDIGSLKVKVPKRKKLRAVPKAYKPGSGIFSETRSGLAKTRRVPAPKMSTKPKKLRARKSVPASGGLFKDVHKAIRKSIAHGKTRPVMPVRKAKSAKSAFREAKAPPKLREFTIKDITKGSVGSVKPPKKSRSFSIKDITKGGITPPKQLASRSLAPKSKGRKSKRLPSAV